MGGEWGWERPPSDRTIYSPGIRRAANRGRPSDKKRGDGLERRQSTGRPLAWRVGTSGDQHRNSLARLRRAAASSDWSLLICERGSSPFHAFPPVTQAANKVRRHCSCARQYATTRQIAGTAWNADLRSAQRPAGPRRVEAQRPDDSRLGVDPKRRAARQTQELHFHDGQGCAGASDHGGFSRWGFHAGTARRQAGEKRKSASGGR